jgi:hypothetical protein
MRWFGTDWHTDELTDEEDKARFDERVRSYREHESRIRPLLSDAVRQLLDINLHDGIVEKWSFSDSGFEWTLLIGDLQVGYQHAYFSYKDAVLIGIDIARFEEMLRNPKMPEVLTQELDIVGDRYEHRFYVWPGYEFGVSFVDVKVTLESAPDTLRMKLFRQHKRRRKHVSKQASPFDHDELELQS